MNANKRVAVNAMATYGRTLLRMGLGLFSSRWVLESLGSVDYGLMGVVGSLIVFITFLNTVLSGACSRFFAYSIGKKDIEDLRKWFNAGLSVHLFMATALVVIGLPVGEWMIDNFLSIPPDRVVTAHWVFRFSLVAAFWTMAATPYMAMYTATQNIAERTLWEIASILTNFGFVYWLTTYKGDAWFVYAGFTVALTVALGIGQVLRARYAFSGCQINLAYWGDWKKVKEMFSFSGWSLFGSLGYLARANVPSVLLNIQFPPIRYAYVNASYQIGGALAAYTQSVSNSLIGAFTPQITTLAGANEKEKMVNTAFNASKFGTLLTLLFAIPVSIEADYLLELWLKNPPVLAAPFCRIVLLQMILDNLTFGHMAGIMASGKIKWYQITTGMLCVSSVPISWIALSLGFGPLAVSWVIAGCMAVCSVARLFFGRTILGIQIGVWAKKIFVPITLLILVTYTSGLLFVFIVKEPSVVRLCMTTIITLISMGVMTWYALFSSKDRDIVIHTVKTIRQKFR